MKASLVMIFLLLMSFSANAAMVACQYQKEACNEQGDQYLCIYYGWAHGEFCSPTDVSTPRRQRPDPDFTCADCYSQARPSLQCKNECGCHISFCGQW